MLHITNGDSAAARIRAAPLPGEVLPWRDVLHEGPVPAGLSDGELREVRARFIADQGWGDFDSVLRDMAARDAALAGWDQHDEIVLWFEHDLYDQLQLAQILAWLAAQGLSAPTRLSLINVAEYLGTLAPERLRALFEARRELSSEQLMAGVRAWEAFRSPDPTEIEALLDADRGALPFLAGALRRHLEEFPSTTNSLSRSERQALEAIAAGTTLVREVYLAAHHAREEAIFLGDSVFALYLWRLSEVPRPLVVLENGNGGTRGGGEGAFLERQARLTEAGRAMLAGQADAVRLNGIDRWLGGVRLNGSGNLWRWDPDTRRLVPSAAH